MDPAAGTQGDLFLQKKRKAHFRIGIDLMGAETPPSLILEAATSLSSDFYHSCSILFFGTQEALPIKKSRMPHSFCIAEEAITMQDHPLKALRKKKKSSLVMGMAHLRDGSIDAFISCANTGALVAASQLLLGTMEGVERTALLIEVPTKKGHVVILDVGASLESSKEILLQHALLGSIYAKEVLGKKRPKVALLNIGTEPFKGTDALQGAFKLLSTKKLPFTFVGNKEPDAIFKHEADVFTTGGFAGNIFIKTAEATAAFVQSRQQLSEQMGRAAVLIGVPKLVLKCHGASSAVSLQNALLQAKELLEQRFIDKAARLQNFP